jgi:hypothetical protein
LRGSVESTELPLIPADRNDLWAKLIDPYIFGQIERNFFSVKIRNKYLYYLGNPNYAKLLYGLHHCFYDGQTAYYFCRKIFNANFYMMIEDLHRLPILSKIGGFSVEKDTPQNSLRSINYAANLLKNKDNVLWIFPQGRVFPPDSKPLEFKNGLAYLAHKAKKVNVIPVAVKYTFIRKHKPEIFIELGSPIVINSGIKDKKMFIKDMEENVSSLAAAQSKRISLNQIDDYETIYSSQMPMLFRMEKYLKNII